MLQADRKFFIELRRIIEFEVTVVAGSKTKKKKGKTKKKK
jgi:hypothetical protein